MLKHACVLVLVAAGIMVAGQDIGAVRITRDAVPQTMNLQGYITDTAGVPVSGPKGMMFEILRGGTPVWIEAQTCTLAAGLFNAVLGSVIPIPFSVFEPGAACEFELTVEGQALSPRVPISSTGFAFRCVKADSALWAPGGG